MEKKKKRVKIPLIPDSILPKISPALAGIKETRKKPSLLQDHEVPRRFLEFSLGQRPAFRPIEAKNPDEALCQLENRRTEYKQQEAEYLAQNPGALADALEAAISKHRYEPDMLISIMMELIDVYGIVKELISERARLSKAAKPGKGKDDLQKLIEGIVSSRGKRHLPNSEKDIRACIEDKINNRELEWLELENDRLIWQDEKGNRHSTEIARLKDRVSRAKKSLKKA